MILFFKGKYSFLSNFYEAPMKVTLQDGKEYIANTLEHAFQALKTSDIKEALQVMLCNTPGQAKRAGRKVTLREDWETIKDEVMLSLLRIKFSNKHLAELLMDTGAQQLEEGNTWNDTYWGVCRGIGDNTLGVLLMQVRSDINRGEIELI